MGNVQEKTLISCKECDHCVRNGGQYFESYHCDLGGFTYRRGNSLLVENECTLIENAEHITQKDTDMKNINKKYKKSHKLSEKILSHLGLSVSEE